LRSRCEKAGIGLRIRIHALNLFNREGEKALLLVQFACLSDEENELCWSCDSATTPKSREEAEFEPRVTDAIQEPHACLEIVQAHETRIFDQLTKESAGRAISRDARWHYDSGASRRWVVA
jgi:hypothetical protein